MGKEEEMTNEVMHLLERVKAELMMKEQESAKMVDPFKDLLQFIESPLHFDDENKVVELSDEDNYQCSQCKVTFEKAAHLSVHVKKVHKGIAKETKKKDAEIKPNETVNEDKKGMESLKSTEDKKVMEASAMEEDSWAEMPGGF